MSYDVKYIGMDVHKEAIVIAVLNESGKLVMESVIETRASHCLLIMARLLLGHRSSYSPKRRRSGAKPCTAQRSAGGARHSRHPLKRDAFS